MKKVAPIAVLMLLVGFVLGYVVKINNTPTTKQGASVAAVEDMSKPALADAEAKNKLAYDDKTVSILERLYKLDSIPDGGFAERADLHEKLLGLGFLGDTNDYFVYGHNCGQFNLLYRYERGLGYDHWSYWNGYDWASSAFNGLGISPLCSYWTDI